jgi:hypothetical protein
MFVRLEISKNGDTYPSAGYYFDDFAYTDYVDPGPGTGKIDLNINDIFNVQEIPNGFSIFAENSIVKIFNASGKLIYNKQIFGCENIYPVSKGIYIIQVKTIKGINVIKHLFL